MHDHNPPPPGIPGVEERRDTPWTVKRLTLHLGPGEVMTFEVLDGSDFSLYAGTAQDFHKPGVFGIYDVPIEAARMLRDFLNYALPA